jgi:hypothetical protein
MWLRVSLLAASVAAIVLLGRSLHSHDRCQSSLGVIFHATFAQVPAPAQRTAIDGIRESCAGDTGLLSAAGALQARGRDREALRLATEATRIAPEDARAWRVVALAADRQAPALARAAERRLNALDPLHPSLNLSNGRSRR